MDYNEIPKAELAKLEKFFLDNKFEKNETIVLEKNENSFLVPIAKESTMEFFEMIFNNDGPFWSAYKELGIGEIPQNQEYIAEIFKQAYFCRNIEEKYIYRDGMKKHFEIINGRLEKKTKITLDNILRLLSAPIDKISITKSTIVNAFRVNEIFLDFENELKESIEAVKTANLRPLDEKDAAVFLSKAVKVMKYSFIASIAESLKLKPNPLILKIAQNTCEFVQKINSNKAIFEETCFLGENIYDISEKRADEEKSPKQIILPKENWFILREAAKFACARYLYAERKAYQNIAVKNGMGNEIFYLKTREFIPDYYADYAVKPKVDYKKLAIISIERKKEFESITSLAPKRIIYSTKWFFDEFESNPASNSKNTLTNFIGTPAGAPTVATGECAWVRGKEDILKDFSGKIIITNYFSPDLVTAYTGILGVISSVGGVLSHPAIIAREKQIPCILQVDGLESIKEGTKLQIDGKSGKITIIG